MAEDWLLYSSSWRATIVRDSSTITLSNGLVRRQFALTPAFGTIDLANEVTGVSALRDIGPAEAHLVVNGTNVLLGGLSVHVPKSPTAYSGAHAFLNRTDLESRLRAAPGAWTCTDIWTGIPEAPFPWTPGRRGAPASARWPPAGVRLSVRCIAPAAAPAELHRLNVTLVYELYDDAPVLAKRVEVSMLRAGHGARRAAPQAPLLVERLTLEQLSLDCAHSSRAAASCRLAGCHGLLDVRTTAAHGSLVREGTSPYEHAGSSEPTGGDPGACEPTLNVSYGSAHSPDVALGALVGDAATAPRAEARFVSFSAVLLLHDSFEPTRQMLARHAAFKLLAPWVQENPLQLHLSNASAAAFDVAVAQAADVGFEAIVLSFGSGFRFELAAGDPYLATLKALVAKANARGLEVGGYDLTVLDRGHGGYGGNVGDEWCRVDGASGALTVDACYASGWRDKLEAMLHEVIDATNLSVVITDGPYGGGACGATHHAHHAGLADSVYQQARLQARFYRALAARGVFVRQPDGYFYDGAQAAPLGYNEQQYSMPRWADLTVSRQGMLRDIWQRPAVSGWMFLPMKDYHAGGAAAAFEPYTEHLPEYGFALAQYLGAGCGMTWRGDRLYERHGDASHALIRARVAWAKAHRDILQSDIVHVREVTGQSLDAFLHVNPRLPRRVGLAMVFNPTSANLSMSLRLPLYYTGLHARAKLTISPGAGWDSGAPATQLVGTLERDYSLAVNVSVPAQEAGWVLIERPDSG